MITLEEVKAVLRGHSADFIRVYLFGSIINGDQDEYSDVDLVVIRHTTLPFFDRIREIFDLYLNLKHPDMLIYTPEELKKILSEPGRYFIKDIIEKGYIVEGEQSGSPSMAESGGK
jgi:predicted nucleotidyltransferase